MPTTSVGLFRDSLPAPQICKSCFKSTLRFSPAKGGASLTFVPFRTLFHPMRRHILRGFRCFHPSPFTFSFIRMPLRAISTAQSFPERPRTTLAEPPPPPSGRPPAGRMAHDLRPDLDQFLPQRRQRPVTHRSPILGAMHVAIAQQRPLHIAKLIEAKQRVVASAAEMPIVGSAFLFAIGLADRTVHVQDQFTQRLAFSQPVNPLS